MDFYLRVHIFTQINEHDISQLYFIARISLPTLSRIYIIIKYEQQDTQKKKKTPTHSNMVKCIYYIYFLSLKSSMDQASMMHRKTNEMRITP